MKFTCDSSTAASPMLLGPSRSCPFTHLGLSKGTTNLLSIYFFLFNDAVGVSKVYDIKWLDDKWLINFKVSENEQSCCNESKLISVRKVNIKFIL